MVENYKVETLLSDLLYCLELDTATIGSDTQLQEGCKKVCKNEP